MRKSGIIFAAFLFITSTMLAQVALNTDRSDPHGSAMFEVKSTSYGFLPPRMTSTERDAIVSPSSGLMIFNTTTNCLEYCVSGFWYTACGCPVVPTVTNPATGEIWMDRNLGASRVAISYNDAAAYGDIYQWGRATEGHESRTSITTTINANTPVPNAGNAWDGLYILEGFSPYDWLIPQNTSLWQGVGGTNNPCPAGFRIPTKAEWQAERESWTSNNRAGAYASPLKLTVTGFRHRSNGFLYTVGQDGNYWSSTTGGSGAEGLGFGASVALEGTASRAYGFSVRCIQD